MSEQIMIQTNIKMKKGALQMKNMRCSECGSKNEYEWKEVLRRYESDEYQVEINVKVPVCIKCGAPIFDEAIENEITKLANEKIREKREIISQSEIINIVKQYNVSQKYLSRLLGWGEITLTRYISGGYTPNKNNSEKLKSIRDPYVLRKIMIEQLEENNEEIVNGTSFQKLLKNVNGEIQKIEIERGKIYQVVNWFLSKSTEENPITHLALQKLLYFSQGWSYVFNDRCLFNDDCEAWAHGAVYRSVYDRFKNFRYKPLPFVEKTIDMPQEEQDVLECVWRFYFDIYNAKTLERICHLEQPYLIARKGYDDNANCEEIMSKESIRHYYSDIAKKYNISAQNPEQIRVYLDELLV